jgi:acetyl-CoA carboxylase carboxyl transferase subunit beta
MSDRGNRWFEQPLPELRASEPAAKPPRDLWLRCPGCAEILYRPKLAEHLEVCFHCGHHFRMGAMERVEMLSDPGSFQRFDAELESVDALGFVDSKPYPRRLAASRSKIGDNDAFIGGSCTLDGRPIELGVFNFRFMGGSMGSVVGESITRLYERARERRCPAIVVSASGGARMQEGILSLMQMAKTCAALSRLREEAGMPYISILTDPTTGGVAASFAMLGDLIIAEPQALIGFAGPRVIEQTIGQSLPEGFQTSEYLLEHGMLDMIVQRGDLRDTVSRALSWMLE